MKRDHLYKHHKLQIWNKSKKTVQENSGGQNLRF